MGASAKDSVCNAHGQTPRHRQPVHQRRQPVHDRRRREPDADDRDAGDPAGRLHRGADDGTHDLTARPALGQQIHAGDRVMCEFFVKADPIQYEQRSRTVRIHGVLTSIRLENMVWDILAEIGRGRGLHDERADRPVPRRDPGAPRRGAELRIVPARDLHALPAPPADRQRTRAAQRDRAAGGRRRHAPPRRSAAFSRCRAASLPPVQPALTRTSSHELHHRNPPWRLRAAERRFRRLRAQPQHAARQGPEGVAGLLQPR